MSLSAETMSKGDFAAFIGVSAGRVSQYINEGKIYGEALDGKGRSARIRPHVARAQLQKTLEPSQRLGSNGAAARSAALVAEKAAPAVSPNAPPPTAPTLNLSPDPVDELALERLKQQRITTARLQREEALELGRYMLADEARREMGRAVTEAFKVMDQAIQEMAKAMAAQFGVPQRDAAHSLFKVFREVRGKASARFKDAAADLPEQVEDEQSIEDEQS
ncbi:hypothetical protein [Ensifer aridi]|uniref:hypothetical protein n=1 Tax=Ensifer aridi TaxID=1708715 RepID=UPI0003F52338|nr:hypothetical protein [Ensifer aridi]